MLLCLFQYVIKWPSFYTFAMMWKNVRKHWLKVSSNSVIQLFPEGLLFMETKPDSLWETDITQQNIRGNKEEIQRLLINFQEESMLSRHPALYRTNKLRHLCSVECGCSIAEGRDHLDAELCGYLYFPLIQASGIWVSSRNKSCRKWKN